MTMVAYFADDDGNLRAVRVGLCVHCRRPAHETGDDVAPFVHDDTGNSFCDVVTPADAVDFAGRPGRTEATIR